MEHLKELNKQQKQAVLHKDGPLLILAGAGAGKTRVITYRILNLIHEGVAPENILAVTFTNKAAKEMKERAALLLSKDRGINLPVSIQTRPYIATFHALGANIIRTHGKLIGVQQRFKIFDRQDSTRAVKEAIKNTGLDPKEFEPRTLLSAISKQKGNAVSLQAHEEQLSNEYFPRLVADVWRMYEKILRKEKALDFDDLPLKALQLLKEHESVRSFYQNAWYYIHIDEYQDTNRVQYELSHLLAGEKKNICVVGDIDQNIYSWRGADLQNILDFEKHYPNATVILLEQNYRSTKNILDASNEIIRKNKNRKEKNLFTDNAEGEKIMLLPALDETHEAYTVTEKVRGLLNPPITGEVKKEKVQPREIAVLYRANFQSRVLEEAFLSEQLPYQVVGVRFFERREVKDVLSFVRLALDSESIVDLKRVINVPPRGIGKVTLLRMVEGKEYELSPALKNKVADFRTLLRNIAETVHSSPPSKTIKYILKHSGLEEKLKQGSDDDLERLENIKELVTLATHYDILLPEEGIEKLLEDAALAADQDELKEDKNAVRLMTVHASKGLEFDYVFIVGLEEGLFPYNSDDPLRDNEEERRLFYVALTRAHKKVFLLYASSRTIFGSKEINLPSEFITDISDELLETEGSSASPLKTIYLE